MHPMARGFALVTSALLLAWSCGRDDSSGSGAPQGLGTLATASPDYEFSELKLLSQTLAFVSEAYVAPERIRPEAMLVAALEAVEREVPAAMFDLKNGVLTLQVVGTRESWDVGAVTSINELERLLRRVAVVLDRRLELRDLQSEGHGVGAFDHLEFTMVNALLGTLDPHSMLMTPLESEEMSVENAGEFGGLGVTISLAGGWLQVEEVLPDSPAHESGLRTGDRIQRVDGISTQNISIDEAVELLRGPVGSSTTLDVVDLGTAERSVVEVTRALVKSSPVQGWALPGQMAYVRILGFHAAVHADVVAALSRVEREEQGLKGVVLDLRGNPGGLLHQAIALSNVFLDRGEIVRRRSARHPVGEVATAQRVGTVIDQPVVVLVDSHSASASEIVAGALRNNERAVIIGQRTFGKGSVQDLHELGYGARLKLTVEHYLTPGERSIQGVGIPADIEVLPAYVGRLEGDAVTGWFTGEHLLREDSLEAHLEGQAFAGEGPAYTLRMLVEVDDAPPPSLYDAPLLDDDPQLQLAVDVLAASRSSHRGDMLVSAAPVVTRHRQRQARSLIDAFGALGVDWTPAANAEAALDVSFDGLPAMTAGEPTHVSILVENRGPSPAGQLTLVGEEHALMEGREVAVGRLDAGETRRVAFKLEPAPGYPSEHAPMQVSLKGPDGVLLAQERALLEVDAVPLPRLSLRTQWVDVVATGEGEVQGTLEVTVRNDGDGESTGAELWLHRLTHDVRLRVGSLRVGDLVDAAGEPCRPEEPGWYNGGVVGATADHPRVLAELEATWPASCTQRLVAGGVWTGRLVVTKPATLLANIELGMAEVERYDAATIDRGGFFEYLEPTLTLTVPDVAEPEVGRWHEPPAIRITKDPERRSTMARVSLSGRVTDDRGVSALMVYAGDNKVFFHATPRERLIPSVPFSATVDLAPGSNDIYVIAVDDEGLVSTTSRVVSYQAPEKISRSTTLQSSP
ncbi:MAG: S41 family peptidase [Myxococcota bacterium]